MEPSSESRLRAFDPNEGQLEVQGVLSNLDAGVGVIGFEGVRVPTAEVEEVKGAIPRVRRYDFQFQSLELALSQGGRAPHAGLPSLLNRYGGPDRVDELAKELHRDLHRNLETFRATASNTPTLEDLSNEAIRMLDAYINRTDELHPFSTELLAQGMTSNSERMPSVGEQVSAPDQTQIVLPGDPEAGLAPWRAAAEHAVENQVEFRQTQMAVATRAIEGLGLDQVRGRLIDQRF